MKCCVTNVDNGVEGKIPAKKNNSMHRTVTGKRIFFFWTVKEEVSYMINAVDASWRSLMWAREQLDRSNLSKIHKMTKGH